jgi:hypothetical protein
MAPCSFIRPTVRRRPGIAGVRDYLTRTLVTSGTAPDREPMMDRLSESLRVLAA